MDSFLGGAVIAGPGSEPPAPPPPPTEPVRRTSRPAVRLAGELLLTVGALALLFAVYLLWWTDVQQHREQAALRHQLEQEWAAADSAGAGAGSSASATTASLAAGQPLASLRIPRLGKGYWQIIVQGTGEKQLAKGPGHYPETALPGQVGNFSVAGHRVTHGRPFEHLEQLRYRDQIIVETVDAWYTYQAIGQVTVLPNDVSVVAPVPRPTPINAGWPAQTFQPGERLLTFTTCTPPHSYQYRLVVHALLVGIDPRAGGFVPKALRG
jgi:sortase A